MAIKAERDIIGRTVTGIIRRGARGLKLTTRDVPEIGGLIHPICKGGSVDVHPFILIIPPQHVFGIAALVVGRAPDSRIERARHNDRMISLIIMGIVAGHTWIRVRTEPPTIGIFGYEIPDVNQVVPCAFGIIVG